MSPLIWEKFHSLPGRKNQNFENLCRGLIKLQFGRYGQFTAQRNQPGIEFYLKLTENCPSLGDAGRWYGWQCKLHELDKAGNLKSASRNAIKDSLEKTKEHFPNLTDWILWTPYILSKQDQDWFKALDSKFTLHLWDDQDVDNLLNGPGIILRRTYFGDLVLSPEELAQRQNDAIQPIRDRWLPEVHQEVEAERTIRRMLGEPGSWEQMAASAAGCARWMRKGTSAPLLAASEVLQA